MIFGVIKYLLGYPSFAHLELHTFLSFSLYPSFVESAAKERFAAFLYFPPESDCPEKRDQMSFRRSELLLREDEA